MRNGIVAQCSSLRCPRLADGVRQIAVVLRLAGAREGFLNVGRGNAAMVEFLDCSSSAACCSIIRRNLAVSLVSKLREVSLVTCKGFALKQETFEHICRNMKGGWPGFTG